jgi:catechol 2,3-dioxygenase-like lactoylglutathione lyase family enzyme
MASRLFALCFDANDTRGLAHFWAEALGWTVGDEWEGAIGVLPTDGNTFQLGFLPVPEPKAGQNRIHLDLHTSSITDQQDFVARLVELGASHIDIGQTPDEPHVVLADPEGNELCVLEHGNKFVDDAGRFGSITCNGSREVGYFWSEVLGWPLVWDQDDETAIRAPDGTGPFITWGPPVTAKTSKNRLHLDVVPVDRDQSAEVERVLSLGATRVDIGQGDVNWVVMADPDGNEFCILRPRDPQPADQP